MRTAGRIVIALLGAVLCVAPAGCGSAQSTASLNEGISNYEARRYALARQQAVGVMDDARGTRRDEAAYLAGLAAYQLGDLDDARQRLLTAARSKDKATAGRAAAQLGLIDLAEDHPLSAARRFETAAEQLDGSESRQAAQHAAMAYQQAGAFDRAERWLNGSSDPGGAAEQAVAMYGGSRYVLQAGAFHSRSHAEQAARELESIADQYRLGPVQIVRESSSRGSALHLVQFGRFATRAEAARTRSQIGRLEFIVVPAAPSRFELN